MWEETYGDKMTLALRQKYKQKQSESREVKEDIWIGAGRKPVHRESLLGGRCSILLPDLLTDMKDAEAAVRYRSLQRPQSIKAEADGSAAFTLSFLPAEERGLEEMKAADRLKAIRRHMERIWKQNVFYDTGEVKAGQTEIPWMDLKAFCLNGQIYSLIFLFDMQGGVALGNFHCSFPEYDRWKNVILKLLTTLEIQEESHERL